MGNVDDLDLRPHPEDSRTYSTITLFLPQSICKCTQQTLEDEIHQTQTGTSVFVFHNSISLLERDNLVINHTCPPDIWLSMKVRSDQTLYPTQSSYFAR